MDDGFTRAPAPDGVTEEWSPIVDPASEGWTSHAARSHGGGLTEACSTTVRGGTVQARREGRQDGQVGEQLEVAAGERLPPRDEQPT